MYWKIFFLLFVISQSCMDNNSPSGEYNLNFSHKEGVVTSDTTAIKVAEAILLPIYGKSILRQKPYRVELRNNLVWVIQGTLPNNWFGGTFYIEISKYDCRVMKIYHSK